MGDACIQCRRTANELGHGATLLTRRRPMGPGEYQICFACAKWVHERQDQLAQEAIRQAERSGV